MPPRDRGRSERSLREPLVRVDVRRVEERELAHRAQHTGDEAVVERRARTGLLVPEDDRPVESAQRHVDVARVALALVRLGHERDRLAPLLGDVLRRRLVHGVVVRGGRHLGVLERDLMLAEVALAFGRLDVHPRRVHEVPDVAQERLDAARAEDRVVDVVEVRRDEIAVSGVPGVLVRRVVHDELELGAGERGEPERRGPVRLCAQDRARRHADGRAVLEGEVALDQRRARPVREAPDRGQVELEHHVAVPGLPRRDLVPVDGVHLHVDGQQVVAALGAVPEDGVEEEPSVDELALQTPLHVGEAQHDGVDLVAQDGRPQLLDGQHPVVTRLHGAHVDFTHFRRPFSSAAVAAQWSCMTKRARSASPSRMA